MILTCISMMISDVEHVLIGHLCFVWKPVYSSAHFLIRLFFLVDTELYEFFIYILEINPLLDI